MKKYIGFLMIFSFVFLGLKILSAKAETYFYFPQDALSATALRAVSGTALDTKISSDLKVATPMPVPTACDPTGTAQFCIYVVTLPIDTTQLQSTSAMISGQITNNGQVNAGGIFNANHKAWFEYSTSPSLTLSIHYNQDSGISSAGYFNGSLDNLLKPNTTYYYKACASGSSIGTQQFCGNIVSFITPASKTSASITSPTPIAVKNIPATHTTGSNLKTTANGNGTVNIQISCGEQGTLWVDNAPSGFEPNASYYCNKGINGHASYSIAVGAQTGGATPKTLGVGMKGNEIKIYQALLQSVGYLPAIAVIDGSYGNGTMSAVLKFQKDKGLTQNGTIDSATKIQLAKLLGLSCQ